MANSHGNITQYVSQEVHLVQVIFELTADDYQRYLDLASSVDSSFDSWIREACDEYADQTAEFLRDMVEGEKEQERRIQEKEEQEQFIKDVLKREEKRRQEWKQMLAQASSHPKHMEDARLFREQRTKVEKLGEQWEELGRQRQAVYKEIRRVLAEEGP